MLNDTTRGGQVIIHKFRMFSQVSGKTIKIALFIGVFAFCIELICFKNILKQDWSVFLNYLDVKLLNFARWFNYHLKAFAKGLTGKENDILLPEYAYFFGVNKVYLIVHLLQNALKTFAAVSIATYILILTFLLKAGKKITKYASSSSVLNAKAANSLTARLKIQGQFNIQLEKKSILGTKLFYLPKNFETKHIFISGSTGSGKTNLLHNFLPQIRKFNQSAIIVDQSLEMVNRYFDPETDIIFNPFDKRTSAWDFFKEVSDDLKLAALANTLFTPSGTDMGENSSWYQNAKTIFIDSVRLIASGPNLSLKDLCNFLQNSDLLAMTKALKNTKSAGILFKDNVKTSTSLLSIMRSCIEWLEYMPDSKAMFTLKDWLVLARKNDKSRFLFLTTKPTTRSLLQPLISIVMDMAVNNLMDMGAASSERIWFIMDELAALKRLPILTQSLAELRKYGGCVLAATQTMSQLLKIYGMHDAHSIYSQFGTKFVFTNDDLTMNKMVSDIVGSHEFDVTQESISYGAHEMRDGVSLAQNTKVKTIIAPFDISALKPLECFVRIKDLHNTTIRLHTKFLT